MQEAILGSATPSLPCQRTPITQTRLKPCTEPVSITSNVVIAGLNAELESTGHSNKNMPNSTIPPPASAYIIPEPTAAKASQENINNLAYRLQKSVDRKLKTFSSPSLCPLGVPRFKILDSIFQRGLSFTRTLSYVSLWVKLPPLGTFKVC